MYAVLLIVKPRRPARFNESQGDSVFFLKNPPFLYSNMLLFIQNGTAGPTARRSTVLQPPWNTLHLFGTPVVYPFAESTEWLNADGALSPASTRNTPSGVRFEPSYYVWAISRLDAFYCRRLERDRGHVPLADIVEELTLDLILSIIVSVVLVVVNYPINPRALCPLLADHV